MRLVLSKEAEADLRQISRFSSRQWERERARAYMLGLRSKLNLLCLHPELGASAEEVRPGLRRCSYISHNAFYRVRGEDIRVVRILHKRMRADSFIP